MAGMAGETRGAASCASAGTAHSNSAVRSKRFIVSAMRLNMVPPPDSPFRYSAMRRGTGKGERETLSRHRARRASEVVSDHGQGGGAVVGDADRAVAGRIHHPRAVGVDGGEPVVVEAIDQVH